MACLYYRFDCRNAGRWWAISGHLGSAVTNLLGFRFISERAFAVQCIALFFEIHVSAIFEDLSVVLNWFYGITLFWALLLFTCGAFWQWIGWNWNYPLYVPVRSFCTRLHAEHKSVRQIELVSFASDGRGFTNTGCGGRLEAIIIFSQTYLMCYMDLHLINI